MISMQDLDAIARTVYGEARGEPPDGMRAVVHVIMNRVAAQTWYGLTPFEVAHKPWQFSCWNDDDPNRPKIEGLAYSNPLLLRCMEYVCQALSEYFQGNDPTSGSTHYARKDISPSWAHGKEPVIIIQNHAFWNNID